MTSGVASGEQLSQFLLRRQEHPLADDVVLGVEEAVDRLEIRGWTCQPSTCSETPVPRAAVAVRLSGRSRLLSRGFERRVRAVARSSRVPGVRRVDGRHTAAVSSAMDHLARTIERSRSAGAGTGDRALSRHPSWRLQERRNVKRRAELEVRIGSRSMSAFDGRAARGSRRSAARTQPRLRGRRRTVTADAEIASGGRCGHPTSRRRSSAPGGHACMARRRRACRTASAYGGHVHRRLRDGHRGRRAATAIEPGRDDGDLHSRPSSPDRRRRRR